MTDSNLGGPWYEHIRNDARLDGLSIVTLLSWSFSGYYVVRAALRAGVFDIIQDADGSAEVDSILKQVGWSKRPGLAALKILEASGLLSLDHGILCLTGPAKRWLVRSSSSFLGSFFERNDLLVEAYRDLDIHLRSGVPAKKLHEHVSASFGLVECETQSHCIIEAFGRPMAAASSEIFDKLFAVCRPEREASVLDIGGGLGQLAMSLRRYGHRGSVEIIDTPPVINCLRDSLEDTSNVIMKAINWREWQPTTVYDYVVLSHSLHEEPFVLAVELLGKAARSLNIGGRMIVVGLLAQFDWASRLLVPILSLNLALEMGSDVTTLGWLRSEAGKLGVHEELVIPLPGGRCGWIAKKCDNPV